jgi:WD40 repeat protein
MWPISGESQPIIVADPAPFECADMSVDEGLVAASGHRSGVSVWDMKSGHRRFLPMPKSVYPNPIYHTRVQKDAVWALTWDGSLLRWDLATGRRELRRKFPVKLLSGMPQAAISPDGSRVAVQQKDGNVLIASTFDADAPPVVLSTHFDLALLKFSVDGEHLLTNIPAGVLDENTHQVALQVWDAESGRLLADVARGSVLHADASKNGRVAYIDYAKSASTNEKNESELVVWDQTQGREVARHPIRGVKTLAISPDGATLAVVHDEDDADQSTQRRISVRRVDDGFEIYNLIVPCSRVAFSLDGSHLVVTGTQGRIDLLDAGSGRLQKQLVNSAGSITSVAFAPHGASIAATFRNRSSFGRSIVSLDSPFSQESQLVPIAIRSPAKTPAVYLPDGTLTYQGCVWQRLDLPPELKSNHNITERTGCLPEAIANSANVCFFLAPDRTLFRFDLTNADKVVHTANPLAAKGLCGAMWPR